MEIMYFVVLLLLGLSAHAAVAQQFDIGDFGDSNALIQQLTETYKSACESNNVKLDQPELVKHIKSCIQPHIDQIMSISKDDRAMAMQVLYAVQQNPISFTQEQRAWIKKQVLVPACKVIPCTHPMKNPLVKGCFAKSAPASKGLAIADLYLDAVCKNDGENVIALLEAGTKECGEAYKNKVMSCARDEALLKDTYLNQTVEETCRDFGKLHQCLTTSSIACGAKASELFKSTFKDVEIWIKSSCIEMESSNNKAPQLPIFSFTSIIIAVILSWKFPLFSF